MRKFAVFFAFLSMILLFSVASFAAEDDLVGHYLEKEMRSVIQKGIMKGYGANKFGPEDPVTREQFSAFLVRALNLPEPEEEQEINFLDVDKENVLYNEIIRAYASGLIKGYPDQTFRPKNFITREEMAVLIDRALDYKGIAKTTVNLTYYDSAKIHPDYVTAVARNTYFGIINGHANGNFGPKEFAKRAHAAAFIDRFLRVVENGGQPIVEPHYQVATLDASGALKPHPESYLNFSEALAKVTNRASQVVLYKGKIVWMNSGIVYTSRTDDVVQVYKTEALTSQLTYLTRGVEMKYIDSDGTKVKVQVADKIGYVKMNEVTLLPSQQIKDRSYYQKDSSGDLIHYIYNHVTKSYASYIYGKAPSFMAANTKYYSWDGINYYNANGEFVGTAYQYFNYLPLRTKTNYTAEQLNSYIKYMANTDPRAKESPMKDLGKAFKEAEEKYRVNALYLFAKAILESAYGTSEIAKEKKNLFGYQAYDKDPMGNAKPFDSYEESVLFVAQAMNERYLDPFGVNYRGAVLGNKGHGMNMRYASDPYWGQKIAGIMYRIDKYLGGKDMNVYEIGKTTTSVNVRHQPNTNLAAQFTYPEAGFYVTILERINQPDGVWIKTLSDHKAYKEAYIHGNYVTPIPIVK